ncbi:MAG: hypothetical protein KDC54_24550, partial [Lewinella sp.]|nr:hypothetical protein [Lewinella sp.]
EGLVVIREGLRHLPNQPDLLINGGNGLANLGNWAEAVDLFVRAANQRPRDVDLLQKIVYCYEELGQLQAAQPYLQALQQLGAGQ